MYINEALIRKVFDEMVKVRPALSKYLIVDDEDEDEEEEGVDYRILGDLIIKNMPWPVGVELRRLFSGSMRQLDRMRLDQIFKTIERIMQFFSFVMVTQLWKLKREGKIEIPESFSKDFTNRISILSMGNYTWMMRSIHKIIKQSEGEFFMPEMGENFDKKFFASLDFWVPERNEIGHYQINLTQEDIEKRCVEYEEKLSLILGKLAFICKYKLVSIKEIIVVKPKFQDARFSHVLGLLNSSDSDFKARELDEENYSDSNSVLLVKTIKNLDDYLNLSPLVIDTNPEKIDSLEKKSLKKDIFLYTKFRGDHLMYLGTEVTEKVDLRPLSTYPMLVDQFKQMLDELTN